MKRYYIKYIDATGLGMSVRQEWFKTIQARNSFYRAIMSAGCQLVGFGQVSA